MFIAALFIIAREYQKWWLTPVIPALGRLRQEDYEFEASVLHTKSISKAKTKR
jgi:hypothetical protein